MPRPGGSGGGWSTGVRGCRRGRGPVRLRGAAPWSSVACSCASGHRHAAVLTGPADVPDRRRPLPGFSRAFIVEAGLPAPAVDTARSRSRAAGRWPAGRWPGQPRPTALFAANNFLTIGVRRGLSELGLRVPEDVALVGFDDLPSEMIMFPFFTVAAQPAYQMGQRAVAVLLERQANPAAPAQDVVLPTELVIRRSSGDPVGPAAPA